MKNYLYIMKNRFRIVSKNHNKTHKKQGGGRVYCYGCNEGQCNLSYIGYTQCKLKQRFSEHAQNGPIKHHILENHPTQKVKTRELLNNVSILYRSNMKTNLTIVEALFIHRIKPQINAQSEFCHGTLSLL